MQNATRTVYGAYIQTCLLLGVPPVYPEHSTLNEKFGIQSGVLPTSEQFPRLRYYTIGNKGHQLVVGAQGIPKPEPVQHRATDAALFGHLPFVLRPVANDLTAGERARYALRREETHEGVRYAAYYLRRMDMTNVVPAMEYKVVSGGTEQTSPFVPNSSNLNPTAPQVNNTGVNVTSGDYVSASGRLGLIINEAEAAELLNVAKVIYDDEGYAIISEIGLCTGVDKVVQVTSSAGGTFNFNEAIGVQIATHVSGMYPMVFSNTGVTIALNVGATEPLLALNP